MDRRVAASPLAHLALIGAFGLLAFGGSVRNGFVWDDEHIIVGNPATKELARIGEVVLSPDEVAPYYRPLNRASYLVDHALFGMRPGGFHAVNLLLHLVNAVLLYLLAKRLLGAGGALVAAALFAVHPINAEAVNFITGRNNLFALAFSLAALLLLDVGVEKKRYGFGVAAGAAFLLALLSKEQGAVVGAVAVAWLLWLRPGEERLSVRRAALWGAPFVAAFGLYLVLRVVSLGGLLGPATAAGGEGVLGRLAANAHVLPRYLWLIAFPKGLSNFHHVTPVPPAWALAATWAAIVAGVIALVRARDRVMTFGAVWFVLQYLPISGLVAIPSTAQIAERYLYVPAVGLWILAAAVVERVSRSVPSWEWRTCARATAFLVLAVLTWRAALRTADWRDDVSLARSAVEADPMAVRAHYNLGVALREIGDLQGAVRAWEDAVLIDPQDAESLTQLGIASAMAGRWTDAERALRQAVAVNPSLGGAHFNLALLCEKTARPTEALTHYREFLATATPLEAALVARAQQRARVLTAELGQ